MYFTVEKLEGMASDLVDARNNVVTTGLCSCWQPKDEFVYGATDTNASVVEKLGDDFPGIAAGDVIIRSVP